VLFRSDDVFNIAGTGNVGIGITTPSSLLEVYNGDFKINDTYRIGWRYTAGDSNMYNWITNSYSSGIQYKAGSWTSGQSILCHDFQTYTGGAWQSRLSILQNGSVGIGTITPATLLQVVGAATQGQGLLNISNTHATGNVYYPAAKIRNTRGDHSYGIVSEFSIGSVGGTDRSSILFYSDAAVHSWNVGQVTAAWGTADSFGIGYRASNTPSTFSGWPTNYFTITPDGNVLIGTTTDNGNKLRVNGVGFFDSGVRTGQPVGTTTNTFVFGIQNNNAENVTVNYGYLKIS
jgi:hypothetical protein